MKPNNLLSIGIPTYKRVNELKIVLEKLVIDNIHNHCSIILIDDGPSEGIDEVIAPFLDKITFLKHNQNEGYANTFVELINRCETEYILLSVDDDFINVEELQSIINYLENNKPDFISTAWLTDGKVHRGRNKIHPISFQEIGQSSIHAPGLIYKVSVAKPFMSFLKNRIVKGCTATYFMPQVIVVYLLKLTGKNCIWHPAQVVYEGLSSPSNLADENLNHYASFIGKYKSTISYISLFDELSTNNLLNTDGKKIAIAFKQEFEIELYKRVTSSLNDGQMKKMWFAASSIQTISQPIKAIKCILIFVLTKFRIRKLLK